ncbi:MAG: diguanylate cyclase, partial [Burkholderiaceae bacterium]
YINKTFVERVNVQPEDILGKDDFQLWPYEIARENRAHDLRVVTRRQPVNLVERAFNLDGTMTYWQVQKFPLSPSGLLGGVAVEITAAKEYETQLKEYQQALEEQKRALEESVQHLEELSATDELTGLKNRRAFDHILESEWAFSSRYETPLSLLALDLDHFKQVNDTLGHPAGDKLLRDVAHVLKRNDRANDTAARIGGEEFVVVLPNTDMQGAAILAERIRREVEAIGVTTISIGIAGRDDTVREPKSMIKAADDALYAAKRSGRNRVCQHGETVPVRHRDSTPTEGFS